jgi:hypothetical protein
LVGSLCVVSEDVAIRAGLPPSPKEAEDSFLASLELIDVMKGDWSKLSEQYEATFGHGVLQGVKSM